MARQRRILCINTHGKGGQDEQRIRVLTAKLDADLTFFDFDRTVSRRTSMLALRRLLQSEAWDLVYQEGTGIAGGASLIEAALSRKQRFVVSSGDPVGGFFHATKGPLVGGVFGLYERLLYRTCSGFIGWTPYLAGAAMSLGARRAVTIEGAVDLDTFRPFEPEERRSVRRSFGLDPDHLVCGIVGSLRWSKRQSYTYGLELIETLKRVRRKDVSMLIVGDGTGRAVLEQRLPPDVRDRVVFTGRIPPERVVQAMNAMDIGFVTQTLDQLGSFRLTTKLPEYLACGLAVAMSPIPGFYDYAVDAGWPLPPLHPGSSEFHQQCAEWLDEIRWDDVNEKRSHARRIAENVFDYEIISRRFQRFVNDLLA